jgi:histone deacetylase HOS3
LKASIDTRAHRIYALIFNQMDDLKPLALCLQPACVKHRWIRTSNASHIYERPERIRAVLLGAAAAISRLESSETRKQEGLEEYTHHHDEEESRKARELTPDVSDLLGSLNIPGSTPKPTPQSKTTISESRYLHVPQPIPTESINPLNTSRTIHTHPALQIVHAPLEDTSLTTLANNSSSLFPQSPYLKQLCTWALEAPEKIRKGECEIPSRYDPDVAGSTGEREEGELSSMVELNQNDLYLGPGSVEAIEGCVSTLSYRVCGQSGYLDSETKGGAWHADLDALAVPDKQVKTVCQAIDLVCTPKSSSSTVPTSSHTSDYTGAFCVIRPPGHHCAQDFPSG